MKITIEPTELHDSIPYPSVSITVPSDDLDLQDTLDVLLNALHAWGFSYVRELQANTTDSDMELV